METHALIPQNPNRDPSKPLGRHIHFDERSRSHSLAAHLPEDATKKLASKTWHRKAPILDQGQVGSCTGNGTAGALGTEPNASDGVADSVVVDEKLAVSIYEKATHLDTIRGSYPPKDTGSSVLAAMKAAKAMGLIAGYKWAFTFADALAALSHLGPLVVGFDWFSGMDEPVNGLVHAAGKLEGGHCFLVRGIDVQKKLVHADNSWGNWGMNGSFMFSWDDFERLLKEDGEAALVLPPVKASA